MPQVLDAAPETLSHVIDGVVQGVVVDARGVDYTGTLWEFMADLTAAEREFFAGEHDPLGNAWAPLAPATIARKGHDTILRETDAMMNSLVADTQDSIRHVQRDGADNQHGLVYGSSDPKIAFHQEGTTRMPARPPVGLNEELLTKLDVLILDRTVEELMRGA